MQGRIQVYSTVDARVQQIANEALEHGLALYERRRSRARGVVQGSVVVLRNVDASILAETGGRQFYKNRVSAYADFNRVTKSLRQPGSAMKPFVYLAAFREGTFNLETIAPDEPIGVPNGRDQDVKWISNYDGQFTGMIPLRTALAGSRNTVAIWITKQIGVGRVIETARSLGIQTPLRSFATTSLGASEVTLLELANAYRALASGILTQPYVIRKIVRDSNEIVFVGRGETSRPISMTKRSRSFRKACAAWCACPAARLMRWTPAVSQSPSWGKLELRTSSGTRSLWAPHTGWMVSPWRSASVSTTTVRWEEKRPAAGVALPVFREVMSRVYGEKVLGRAPRFPAEMERHIDMFLQNDAANTHVLAVMAPPARQGSDFLIRRYIGADPVGPGVGRRQ